MSDDMPERDYDVGYGKPPSHTQFKKGQSGNPSGRRRGSKSARALLEAELATIVTYQENGRQKKATKLEITLKQAVNDAMKGKPRMLLEVVKGLGIKLTENDGRDGPKAGLEADDLAIVQSFLRRVGKVQS